MMRLLWIFSHPAPYKREFFSLLGKENDLTVIFEEESEEGRDPAFYQKGKGGYEEIFLPKKNRLSFLNHYLASHFFDLIIVNGWANLPEMAVIHYLNAKKMPYVFLINGGRIKGKESCLRKYLKRKFIRSKYASYLSPDPISSEYLRHYAGRDIPIYEYVYSTIHEAEIPLCPATVEERKEALKRLHIPGEKLYVSIGNYIERKNLFILLETWKQMPKNETLLLLGNGKERNNFEKYIKRNHLDNVILGGFHTHEETLEYLRYAECSLFPTKEDIYGHAVNESLSQGTPVICSPNTNAGLHLVQGKGDGIVLSFDSPDNIQEAIHHKVDESMRFKALEVARENTYEKMLESFRVFLTTWKESHL